MKQIFVNTTVHTMTSPGETFSAVLVEDGIIRECYVVSPKLTDAVITDLSGVHLFPGLVDAHTHSFEGGLYSLGVDLTGCSALYEVFERLAQARLLGGMIFAYRFDETILSEQRFPTMAELDRIRPDIPLLLRRVDGHSCIVNTIAAKALYDTTGLVCQGVLGGRDNDIAAHWFHRHLGPEGVLSAYHRASELAIQVGHTGLHAMIGDAGRDLLHYRLIRDHLGEFPIEFHLYPQILDVKTALDVGATRVGGCILVDGAVGSHTAALLEPYADAPNECGRLYRTDEQWLEFYKEADSHGLQVAVHAIGDAAVRQIVNVCKHLPDPAKNRHQIIHCELTDDTIIDDMGRMGLNAAMQPAFDALWGGPDGLYAHRLGEERRLRMNRLRSMTERGIRITGGSDWYITDLDPLAGIRAAVEHHVPEQRLTPFEALCLYTRHPAEITFEENVAGQVKPGYRADFTLFDHDPLTTPLSNVHIRGVVCRGQLHLAEGQ